MTDQSAPRQSLPQQIEVYELGFRRLYVKTRGGPFAIFEDELTPAELIAIANDISARQARTTESVTIDSSAAA